MAEMTQEELEKMSPEELLEMQKKNCIFCKIIAGDIPSNKIHEDKDFIAILDINPAAKGHILILPKQHIQILPQMPPDLVGKLGVFTKNVSKKMISALNIKGTSVFVANGAVAGQKAPHFMLHIIPRKQGDDVPLNPGFEDVSLTHTKLREKLAIALTGKPPQDKQDDLKKEQENDEETNEIYENGTNSDNEDDLDTHDDVATENETDHESDREDENAESDEDKEESDVDLDAISKYING